MTRLMLIGLAGAIGALSRYGVQAGVAQLLGRPTLLGTFAVNVSGAFVLGLLIGLIEGRGLVSGETRIVLAVGFLGAYTTFSTLMFESVDKVERGDALTAIAYIGGSVLVGLLATYAGLVLGRAA